MSDRNGQRPAYVAIARKAFERDPFWSEPRVFSKWEAWVDLIQLAQWKPGVWQTGGGQAVPLDRGETRPLSRSYLATRWGWGEKATRGYLKGLLDDRLRAGQRTTQGPTYHIVNYDTYQGDGPAEGQQRASEGPAEGQATGQQRATKQTISTTHHTPRKGGSTTDPPEMSGRGASRAKETWLTPYWNAWLERFGSDSKPPAGPLAKALRPLDKKHGPEEVLSRWRYFLSKQDAQFVSAPRFAQTYGDWDPSDETLSTLGHDDDDFFRAPS